MDGLIIKQHWLELVLEGAKCWEIRGSRTQKRGAICLIQSGSSMIYGRTNIADCIPLTREIYERNRDKHRIEADYDSLPYKQPYAWVFEDTEKYSEPIPYQHPQGAVIWIKDAQKV